MDMSEELKNYMLTQKKAYGVALGSFAEDVVNKYIMNVCNVVAKNDALSRCRPESIHKVALTSACLGVPVDARGYAYIIPYKGDAQFQLSYKGYIYIAKRDRDVDNIQSFLVYEDDTFEIDMGINTIKHIPNLDSKGYGVDAHIKYAYAKVTFKKETGRSCMFEVMTKKQIDEIRTTSPNGGEKDKYGNDTIWQKYYGEMVRKTIIKRLCKHAQLGDVAIFDEIDNGVFQGKIINIDENGMHHVKDAFLDDRDKIILAVGSCKNKEDLEAVKIKFNNEMQDIVCYRKDYSKQLKEAFSEKQKEFLFEEIQERIDTCESADEVDSIIHVYSDIIKSHNKAFKDEIKEYVASVKMRILDNKVQ